MAETSNLRFHAERELDAIGETGAMRDHLLRMVDAFAAEGHSGLSAAHAANALNKLFRFEPLAPLTGDDSEWMEVSDDLWQNLRCSHVFKNSGGAYDIQGRVFREPNGVCFTNCESSTPVTFPYTPKTEYVDVAEGGEPLPAPVAASEPVASKPHNTLYLYDGYGFTIISRSKDGRLSSSGGDDMPENFDDEVGVAGLYRFVGEIHYAEGWTAEQCEAVGIPSDAANYSEWWHGSMEAPTLADVAHVFGLEANPHPSAAAGRVTEANFGNPAPVVPVVTEAIKDADGSPVLVYMVLDQHNTPVAHSQDKDDADFAACQLVNDEQVLRVVPCHLTGASEVRG